MVTWRKIVGITWLLNRSSSEGLSKRSMSLGTISRSLPLCLHGQMPSKSHQIIFLLHQLRCFSTLYSLSRLIYWLHTIHWFGYFWRKRVLLLSQRTDVQIQSRWRNLIFLDVYYILCLELNFLFVKLWDTLLHWLWYSVRANAVFLMGDSHYSYCGYWGSWPLQCPWHWWFSGACPGLPSTISSINSMGIWTYTLSQLVKEDLVVGLPEIQIQSHGISAACQAGKQPW